MGDHVMSTSRFNLHSAAAWALLVVGAATNAHASGNVVMALDGMIVNNTGGGQPGWGGYGRFTYGSTVGPAVTPTLGQYDAFTFSEPGSGGSGVGVNFGIGNINSPVDAGVPVSPVTSAMFPLLDRATFGINFNPSEYVAELIYKPLEGNSATQLNMTLDTTDGFTADGLPRGEQWQWSFPDLVNYHASAEKDADGFAIIRNNGAALLGPNGERTAGYGGANAPSYMYATAPLPAGQAGDDAADFNDFESDVLPVPNGAVQIHLQTVYGGGQELIDNWEIKALRIVRLNPDPNEVVRLDGHSGFSQRFGSPFARNPDFINIGGVDYDPPATDQVSRFNASGFTNIVLNTDDDTEVGGLGLWQPPVTQTFDGEAAMMEIRARLTAPLAGQADHIVVLAKDKDGNDTGGVGDFGGEEYHFNIPLSSFNEAGMTTLTMPFSAATVLQAQEFANGGDASATDFNLYYLGLQTDPGVGLVDLEIEFVRVTLPSVGVAGDFDGDLDVDGNDFLVWQQGLGVDFDASDLADWKANYGTAPGVGAAGAVPEPAAAVLVMGAIGGAAAVRRRQPRA
jgi:hypothetical protein